MKTMFPEKFRLSAAVVASVLLIACSDSSDRTGSVEPPVEPPEPELTYQTDIVWTEYGIPHVTADDWGSLGYGVGYAYARDNYCTVMREYVRAEMRATSTETSFTSCLMTTNVSSACSTACQRRYRTILPVTRQG